MRRQEAEAQQQEAQAQLQQIVMETLASRFPDVPARLITRLPRIRSLARLGALHHTILEATDLAAIEATIMAETA